MVLGSTQASNRNEYQESFLGRADNPPNFMFRLSENHGNLNRLEPSGPIYACYRDSLTFYLFSRVNIPDVSKRK
jgi:hypothetical protein